MVEIKAVYEGQLHCTATHGPSGMTLTTEDRKSTRLNSSHSQISYAVFCLKKKMIVNSIFTLSEVDSILSGRALRSTLLRTGRRGRLATATPLPLPGLVDTVQPWAPTFSSP